MFLLKLLSLFALCVASSNGARILAVFPGPGYSQFILAEKLLTTLTKRGHEVTVISPFEPKVPPKNYTTVSLRGIVETVFGPCKYISRAFSIHVIYVLNCFYSSEFL